MTWMVRMGLTVLALAAVLAVRTEAAPQSWTGKISDAMCAGNHNGKDAKECTAVCVKGGDKYVLVVDKKVYQIENQKFADLAKFAGADATVTGELGKNDTITITKMVAPAKK